MNILFLDQFSEPGGAQLCLRDLLPEITRRGWYPQIMLPGNGELLQWNRRAGIPVHALPLRKYSNGSKTPLDALRFAVDIPRAAAALREIVRRERIDLVYVNGPRAFPAVLGLACPVVFHAHNHVGVWYGRKIIDWTARAVNATVIAASEHVARNYATRARVIYNGVPDLWRGPRRFDRLPLRIGILGRIAPEKGHLDFVRAARKLTEQGCRIEFFVYGAPLFSEPEYAATVREIAQDLPIQFCGWTDDIAHALHNLEILAVPSGSGDNVPRVVMEALSAGTPIVAYRSGGIPEMIEDGRTAVLTDAAHPDALVRGVRRLIDDPRLLERLSAAGRREWQRRFRVEQFRTGVCDLLEVRARASGQPRPQS